jgi:hypothetical protein
VTKTRSELIQEIMKIIKKRLAIDEEVDVVE